jgi:hypothetical protein
MKEKVPSIGSTIQRAGLPPACSPNSSQVLLRGAVRGRHGGTVGLELDGGAGAEEVERQGSRRLRGSNGEGEDFAQFRGVHSVVPGPSPGVSLNHRDTGTQRIVFN